MFLFWLFFSFYNHCQLVKGQIYQKSGTLQSALVSVSKGLLEVKFRKNLHPVVLLKKDPAK